MGSARAGIGRLVKGGAVGAGLGLALFAAESVLILRAGSVGLKVDLKGPLAALLATVKPVLPWLLARVAVTYALGFGVLGVAAAVLAAVWPVEGKRARAAVFAGELLALTAVLWTVKAISRPALFDDVPGLRGALEACAESGRPWMPRVFGFAWLLLHTAVAARRWGPRAAGVGGLVTCVLIGLVGIGRPRGGLEPGDGPVLTTAGSAAAPSGEPAGRPRTLVLIGIDAFRADRLKALGGSGEVAPNLERFLGDATLFTSAWTPIAQTEPAWRSLVTARWPHVTGVRYPLTADERWVTLPTFPAALAAAGYRTRFATDCSRFNFQPESSGFVQRDQPPRGAVNFLLEKLRYRAVGAFADNAAGAAWLPEFIDNRALAGIHDPIGYARRLGASWVRTLEEGPALLAFHATAAHFPGDPSYPFYRRFVRPSAPLERRLRMVFSPIATELAAPARADGWSRADAEALYDEQLAQADAQVGILLQALKDAGRYDDALIVVFSDHGESFHADMPALSGATSVHGARLSSEENRILLALKLPRGAAPAPRTVDALVRLVDLGPTFLAQAGLPPLSAADGASLLPLLRGEAGAPRKLYAETGFTHASPEVFDPGHWKGASRSFEAYEIRPDGVLQMSEASHAATLKEKDVGAFDGQTWVIRSPRQDGSVAQRCTGACAEPSALWRWLEEISASPDAGRYNAAP